MDNFYSLGIDLGSSSLKVTLIDSEFKILFQQDIAHKGNPYDALKEQLRDLERGFDVSNIKWGGLVGTGGSRVAKETGLKTFPEVIAQSKAVHFFHPEVRTIIELGGQNGKFISLNNDGSVHHFAMNTDCSAGTGSFLEEQALRLGINLTELSELTEKATNNPRIAGRCSVFAKTDIIHLQQEGTSVNDILLGLCYAVIRTFKAAVVRSKEVSLPILIHGGVAQNKGIVKAIKDVFNLKEGDYVVPRLSRHLNGLGAAMLAQEEKAEIHFSKLMDYLESNRESSEQQDRVQLQELTIAPSVDTESLHIIHQDSGDCFLGIDVGSTSTNILLINQEGQVVDYRYLRTRGNPIEAVRQGINELKEFHESKRILGVGVTGSGRYLISDFVGGDVVKDEITAQAKAAIHVDPEVDTIFEIGGQDSKFIRLENGVVVDFEMNKVCAAGTGSFIEEQTKKLGVTIEECGPLALKSKRPLVLGERCTVFMETNVGYYLSKGAPVQDILAGLSYSVARNYLNRVVAGNKIGEKIFFQGGVAYNKGILAAFHLLTGKQIVVPPFFSVTGAWGVALLARDEMKEAKPSKFLGWNGFQEGYSITKVVCSDERPKASTPPLFQLRDELFMKDYSPKSKVGKPTIGIPRVLFMYKMFPMFQALFHSLDFNVVISDDTDERIVALSERYTIEETCYPVKLVIGHVLDLMEKGVDYVFLPSIATMKHPVSKTRQDYPCMFMQSISAIIDSLLGTELAKRNIKLIKPVLSFKFGRMFMIKTFIKMGLELGKNPVQVVKAVKKGFKMKDDFEKKLELAGEEYLKNLSPDEKVLVLITRPYGVMDQQLNMQIPQQLAKMGVQIIPKDALPINNYDISDLHTNMYWPFGQHILSAIKITKDQPNLYPVFLTNHGCGPDTALTHYVAEIMGDKPYLHLEVDEHSSPVGIITRLEAFINSLNNQQAKPTEYVGDPLDISLTSNFNRDKEVLIPNIGPHANAMASALKVSGYKATVMETPGEMTIEIGRTFTITKEYFSLVALLGSVFKSLRDDQNRGRDKAILVPSLEGAEVDGQYPRLLKSVLNTVGFSQVQILAPFLEDMLDESGPLSEEDIRTFFKSLLVADLLIEETLKTRPYSDQPEKVNEVFRHYMDLIGERTDYRELIVEASQEFSALRISQEKRPLIGILGEPYILYEPNLNSNLVERIEKLGAEVTLPYLTEILCYHYYHKKLEAKNKKEFNTYLKYSSILSKLSIDIKNTIPNKENPNFINSFEEITQFSKDYLPYLSGGFGFYRIGKGQLWGEEGLDGIIHLTSLYENTGLLVNILAEKFVKDKGLNWLNIGVDGKKNSNDEIRLETFIQTLRRRRVEKNHVSGKKRIFKIN